MTVAEGEIVGRVGQVDDVLQWGRNLTVAEGSNSPSRLGMCLRHFNGAAT